DPAGHPSAKIPRAVSPPSPAPGGSLPTGQVFNGPADFKGSSGGASAPARFIFASQTGEISGWSPAVPPSPTVAHVTATVSGASFTGLALGNVATATYHSAHHFC